jgi:hypothetical protein
VKTFNSSRTDKLRYCDIILPEYAFKLGFDFDAEEYIRNAVIVAQCPAFHVDTGALAAFLDGNQGSLGAAGPGIGDQFLGDGQIGTASHKILRATAGSGVDVGAVIDHGANVKDAKKKRGEERAYEGEFDRGGTGLVLANASEYVLEEALHRLFYQPDITGHFSVIDAGVGTIR